MTTNPRVVWKKPSCVNLGIIPQTFLLNFKLSFHHKRIYLSRVERSTVFFFFFLLDTSCLVVQPGPTLDRTGPSSRRRHRHHRTIWSTNLIQDVSRRGPGESQG